MNETVQNRSLALFMMFPCYPIEFMVHAVDLKMVTSHVGWKGLAPQRHKFSLGVKGLTRPLASGAPPPQKRGCPMPCHSPLLGGGLLSPRIEFSLGWPDPRTDSPPDTITWLLASVSSFLAARLDGDPVIHTPYSHNTENHLVCACKQNYIGERRG